MKKLNLQIEYVDIAILNPYKRNVKLHPDRQIEQIMRSIKEFGFNDPIGIDKKDGVIIEGHGRLIAAYKLGITEIPIIDLSHLDKTEQRLYRIAHNKLTMNTDMNLELLIDEFEELRVDKSVDLTLTGYEEEELEMLILDEEEKGYLITGKEDVIPDSVDSVCKEGDLWFLDKHRLLVGDTTKKKDVERLMNNKKADMVFTSPPYNQGGKGSRFAPFYEGKGDNLTKDEYRKFLFSVLRNMALVCKQDTSVLWNVMYNANSRDDYGKIVFSDENPFVVKETIIWDKGHSFNISTHGILSRDSELIFLMSLSNKYQTKQGQYETWFNTWRIGTQKSQIEGHGAAFPVELPEKGILMFCVGSIVYEPFLGTGSTLIACERTNKICYACEIKPSYCDIILQRYIDYTDKDPIREDGVKFSKLRNKNDV